MTVQRHLLHGVAWLIVKLNIIDGAVNVIADSRCVGILYSVGLHGNNRQVLIGNDL